MRQLFCLINFIFLFSPFAALSNIDSLEQKLRQNPDDTTRVQLYLKLTWAYKDSSPEKANAYIQKAKQHAASSNYLLGLANAHYYQAILHYLEGNYTEASMESAKAKPLYIREKSDYGLASLLNLLGLIQMQQTYYPEALESFQEVYRIGEKNKDLYSLSNAINNMAIIYERIGDISAALTANLKALEIRQKIGDLSFIGESYLEIGISYYRLMKYDSSRYYLLEAKPIFEKTKSIRSLASVFNSLGTIGLDEGQFGVALHYFVKAAALLAPLDDKHLYVPILVNLGQVQYELGRYDEAEKTLLSCKNEAEALRDYRNLAFSYEWLSKLKEKQGEYKTALSFERKRLIVIDSILNEEKSKQLTALNSKFETTRKEKQLAEQNVQLQIQAYSLLKQRFWTAGLGGLVLLISFLSGIFIVRSRARNKIAIKQAIIQEQKRGIDAVLEATEAERQHIARDLHDSLAQQLAALKIGIGRFRDQQPDVTVQLDSLLELASSSAEEARNIAHRLIPKTLLSLGLAAAVKELFTKCLQPAGITYYVEAEEFQLTEKTATALYRVIQELVNNTMKHSGADFVVCRLKLKNENLRISFEDNGKNFNPALSSQGLGMMNMRTRLQAFEGSIQFVNNEDGGMRAEISVPLQAELFQLTAAS